MTANVWSDPPPQQAAEMAAFIEARARYPDQAAVNAALVEAVAPHPGEQILEVGCGSGLLCRLLAPAVAPQGSVSGLDRSAEMLAQARERAQAAGVDARIRFEQGEAADLPYADETFDAALAARLLLHVDDPAQVVRELRRVVRPRGRVVLMDWDFDSLTVDHPDRALTRRLLHWRSDFYGGNNWSGRQLVGHLVTAGLAEITVVPVVCVARDENAALTQSLWRAAQVACDGGAISAAERAAWVGSLQQRIAAGSFMAGIVYFIAIGTVPLS